MRSFCSKTHRFEWSETLGKKDRSVEEMAIGAVR